MVLLLALMVEAQSDPGRARIQIGQIHLFDGTLIRTATEAEAHLKKLLEAKPGDDFLWDRLGNLYRSAEELDRATAAYQKAVELNPYNVEAHYSLGCCFMDRAQKGRATEHFCLVLRHCRVYRRRQPQLLHDLVRDTLECLFALHAGKKDLSFLPPFDPAPAQGGDGRIPQSVLLYLDLTTDKGWETLTTIYLTGTLPASPQAPPPAGLLGNRGILPAGQRVGRNERCPCGSGKKFKHCCGRGR
jgi:tetratricopeptide (TPR) repeat protein